MPVVTSRDPLSFCRCCWVSREIGLTMDLISYLYGAMIFIGGLIGYFKAGEFFYKLEMYKVKLCTLDGHVPMVRRVSTFIGLYFSFFGQV